MKALSGGKTPCLLDPILVPLGMDKFWSKNEAEKEEEGETEETKEAGEASVAEQKPTEPVVDLLGAEK